MADLLVDTDILVDHLRTGSGRWLQEFDVAYSTITRAELFAGRGEEEPRVRALLAAMHEVPVDRDVAELGGAIRRRWRIALPDALIAASAVLSGASLVTQNVRHFGQIDGLRLREPR